MSLGSCESVRDSESRETPVIQRISPRTLPGILTNANKGAIDWGWQSFVAYGCHNHVVVIDPQNVKVFQTLEQHRADVVKVKWAKETYYHDLSQPYLLKLASADCAGTIIVWDVINCKEISSFTENQKAPLEIEWLTGRDSCHHLLVALHPPYSLIVWDTNLGTKLWKKSYTEVLLSFAFDPFADNRMAFLASDCILFVDDFSINKVPSSNGRKFCITNPSSTQQSNNSWASGESKSRSIIPKRMRFLVRADSKLSDDGVTINECLQLSYHRSYRQHLLLLYSKEILMLDLDINQTVGIVSIDQSGSNIMHMYSCWQRDAFFLLHDNGCVSFRLRHRGHRVMAAATPLCGSGDMTFNPNDPCLEVAYDLHCQSDSFRLTKHAKIMGFAVCRKTESKITLLISDGRMMFFDLIIYQKQNCSEKCWVPHLSGIVPNIKTAKSGDFVAETLPLTTSAIHPATSLSDHISPALYPAEEFAQNYKESAKFRLLISGHLTSLAAPPHVMRMCPPVTFRNWKFYEPLMAVGNAGGSIQVINMATGMIVKEFSVHAFPVRGIEWIGLTSFMSYAHTNTVNNLGHVKNEVVLTDILSGRTKSLRAERQDESPIEMIRVSCLRQYAIIVFKEEPFELWDLRQLTVLRTMPKNFPFITALEWSPVHKKQHTTDAMRDHLKEPLYAEYVAESDVGSKALNYTKEHFIFTDTNGQLHHFSVEGNIIQDGTTIPADFSMECITCIAWKGDYIVLGMVDGNVSVLHLKDKFPKVFPTHRGWIKKIRIGPGKGNTRAIILFNDGCEIWDYKEKTLIHSIRCPRDMCKIRDIDWVGSDGPCVATADGCIRITDIKLKVWSSAVKDYDPSEMPFCPYMLSPRSAFYLKSYLQHPKIGEALGSDIGDFGVQKQLDILDPSVKEFLSSCPFSTAERALHMSRLFGDEESVHFWTVTLHYLKQAKIWQLKNRYNGEDIESLEKSKSYQHLLFEHPLDTIYDVFCDNQTFKKLQLDRVSLHVHKRTTYAQTQQCAERLLLLGETEKSVQLLLETDTGNKNFYVDCLRACLTATIHSSGTSLSVVKLVSTNLIASGHIMEGVQLLCLIEKGLDACKYLLTSDRWDEAVWLAKATLPSSECHEILRRWIDHLCSSEASQKNKAVLILLTMKQFWNAIKMLHSNKMTERAALLLQACLDFGVLERNDQNSNEMQSIFEEYELHLRDLFGFENLTKFSEESSWW